MDSDRARELVTLERRRIGQALAAIDRPGSHEASDRIEPGDGDLDDVYQDEVDAGRAEDLHRRLAALERAEAPPEAGNYQLSIESGEREWCDR
jgi:hypothetical protein